MKCPKCGYTSFDYLRKCKKCDELLDDSRKALNLKMNEPTLFAGLKDDRSEADKSEVDKAEEIVDTTPDTSVSSLPEADFSPLVTGSLPDVPPPTPDPIERRPQELSENIPSEPSSELGALGDMDNLQPRQDGRGDLETLLKIELESGSEGEGLELTPSFIADSNRAEDLQNGEKNKEGEFVLFEDENKDDPPAALGQMENDIPFEFSANDLEDDISLSLPSDTTDKDMIELELDMEDEESLDQILADLGENGSSKK